MSAIRKRTAPTALVEQPDDGLEDLLDHLGRLLAEEYVALLRGPDSARTDDTEEQ
jgi:hypothetical protein